MGDVMMPIDDDYHSESNYSIRFNGEFTSKKASEYRDVFLKMVRECEAVTLDFDESVSYNLSFVQFILSAQKTAKAAGKELSFARSAPNPLLAILERAGFVGRNEGNELAHALKIDAPEGKEHTL
jgi:hypothetical protein